MWQQKLALSSAHSPRGCFGAGSHSSVVFAAAAAPPCARIYAAVRRNTSSQARCDSWPSWQARMRRRDLGRAAHECAPLSPTLAGWDVDGTTVKVRAAAIKVPAATVKVRPVGLRPCSIRLCALRPGVGRLGTLS